MHRRGFLVYSTLEISSSSTRTFLGSDLGIKHPALEVRYNQSVGSRFPSCLNICLCREVLEGSAPLLLSTHVIVHPTYPSHHVQLQDLPNQPPLGHSESPDDEYSFFDYKSGALHTSTTFILS
ncbi:hypothetical protein E1B28_003061 [Marasmius oreades]|uniref:Uncharacterized protein n=1 Tax=Marasmius oreades TaxID=181124 RepID=A0A9P7RKY1_9AGAR|nr:uncharacterized protein E1B28_003061 [Marasmius oreades]KAG7085497.1 hypothetical protein E1B28_003061 [Marasmius oreades]